MRMVSRSCISIVGSTEINLLHMIDKLNREHSEKESDFSVFRKALGISVS